MKIIVSEKVKIHMEVHKNDFIINWEELMKICKEDGKFNHLHKPFEILKVEFQFNVGYCNCVDTDTDDEVIFAKRHDRDTYTRFVKNREAKLVKSVIFILNKNRKNFGEHYLVIMFPGKESLKEPEDLNIKSKEELTECLEFWQNHAPIYDEEIIDINTMRNYCPYKNLYIAIA